MGRWVLCTQCCNPCNPHNLPHTKLASAFRFACPQTSNPLRCHLQNAARHQYQLHFSASLFSHAGNKVARRLREEGCQVAAWNRDPSKAEGLAAAGVSVHRSAQDAAQASDVLVLMLSDAGAIKDVLLNRDQPVNLEGKVVIQMGTIGQPPVAKHDVILKWFECSLSSCLLTRHVAFGHNSIACNSIMAYCM